MSIFWDKALKTEPEAANIPDAVTVEKLENDCTYDIVQTGTQTAASNQRTSELARIEVYFASGAGQFQ